MRDTTLELLYLSQIENGRTIKKEYKDHNNELLCKFRSGKDLPLLKNAVERAIAEREVWREERLEEMREALAEGGPRERFQGHKKLADHESLTEAERKTCKEYVVEIDNAWEEFEKLVPQLEDESITDLLFALLKKLEPDADDTKQEARPEQ